MPIFYKLQHFSSVELLEGICWKKIYHKVWDMVVKLNSFSKIVKRNTSCQIFNWEPFGNDTFLNDPEKFPRTPYEQQVYDETNTVTATSFKLLTYGGIKYIERAKTLSKRFVSTYIGTFRYSKWNKFRDYSGQKPCKIYHLELW